MAHVLFVHKLLFFTDLHPFNLYFLVQEGGMPKDTLTTTSQPDHSMRTLLSGVVLKQLIEYNYMLTIYRYIIQITISVSV